MKKQAKPHILIFGTSNSLLKGGWVAGLQSTGLVDIKNLSVGGSPGTRFAAHADEDWSVYDYVIFDSIPNDEVLAADVGDNDFNDLMLELIFSEIVQQTRLIVLGFCWKQYAVERSSAFERHERLARKVGAQFVDMVSLVCSFGVRQGLEINDLYEAHHAHPDSAISYQIGRAIGAALSVIDSKEWLKPTATRHPSAFRIVRSTSSAYADKPKQVRSNSRVSGEFVVLGDGERLAFPEGRCIGAYLNLAKTDCMLTLEGNKERKVFKLFTAIKQYGQFTKAYVALPDIRCRSFLVSSYEDEVDYVSRHSRPSGPISTATLEVSDVCFISDKANIRDSVYTAQFSRSFFDIVSTIFHSEQMSPHLGQLARQLYERKFAWLPHIHLLKLCRTIENEGESSARLMAEVYDFAIAKYGHIRDGYNDPMFAKEKYRSLINLQLWEDAETFSSAVPGSLKTNAWPHLLKARELDRLGESDQAADEWAKVLSATPNSKEAQRALGLID